MDAQEIKQVREDAALEPQVSSAPPSVEPSEFELDVALSMAVKINGRRHTNFPTATVPGSLQNVDFMVKDSKRFADSSGSGYAVFDATATPTRSGQAAQLALPRRETMRSVGLLVTRWRRQGTASLRTMARGEATRTTRG